MNRMYVPDEEWDDLVNASCDLIDYLKGPLAPAPEKVQDCIGILQAFINLQDKPIPIVLRRKLKGFHRIKKGREYMRKFTKYYFILWAKERISKLKINSTRSTKSR